MTGMNPVADNPVTVPPELDEEKNPSASEPPRIRCPLCGWSRAELFGRRQKNRTTLGNHNRLFVVCRRTTIHGANSPTISIR